MCGLMLSASLSFMGCSSDDEEDGAPKTDNYYITTNDGERLLLTRVGNYSFEYDSKGLLSSCNVYGDKYDISFAQNKITSDYGYTATFKLNGSGYISSITFLYEGDDTNTGTTNFAYDGSGRLVSVSGNYSDDGDKGSFTCKLTYNNGKLVKTVYEGESVEDGERFTEKETSVVNYDNNAMVNILGQCSKNMVEIALDVDEIGNALFLTGYLGKPSSYFPTSVDCEYSDSEGYNESDTESYRYTFNSNGTLATEDGMSYSYSNMPTVGDDKTRSVQTPSPRKHHKRHGFRLIK